MENFINILKKYFYFISGGLSVVIILIYCFFENSYTQLAVILLLFALIICLVTIKWNRNELKISYNFIVVILGTFAGVLYAGYFNQKEAQKYFDLNQEENKKYFELNQKEAQKYFEMNQDALKNKEKADFEKILQNAKGNVFSCMTTDYQMKISSIIVKNKQVSYNIFYPIFPVVLSHILTMDIVLRNITQTSLEFVSFNNSILNKLYPHLNKIGHFDNNDKLYNEHLIIAFRLLKNEIKHSQDSLNDGQLLDSARHLLPMYKIGY